jgi:hypothetical protein
MSGLRECSRRNWPRRLRLSHAATRVVVVRRSAWVSSTRRSSKKKAFLDPKRPRPDRLCSTPERDRPSMDICSSSRVRARPMRRLRPGDSADRDCTTMLHWASIPICLYIIHLISCISRITPATRRPPFTPCNHPLLPRSPAGPRSTTTARGEIRRVARRCCIRD